MSARTVTRGVAGSFACGLSDDMGVFLDNVMEQIPERAGHIGGA